MVKQCLLQPVRFLAQLPSEILGVAAARSAVSSHNEVLHDGYRQDPDGVCWQAKRVQITS